MFLKYVVFLGIHHTDVKSPVGSNGVLVKGTALEEDHLAF